MALRVALHAPTPGAVARARSNARNLRRADPDAEIVIVVNADGVGAVMTPADEETDALIRVCANSLARQGLEAPAHVGVVEVAVLALAEMQRDGWAYIRA